MKLIERTNNPLNIRFSSSNYWRGQTANIKGFCAFKSMDYGYRAAYLLLCNYIRNGHNTIESIINRWAPPSENNTENYIKFVEEETMIDKHKTLGYESLYDYWTIILIICAMARMETGLSPQPQDINVSLGKVL